MSEPWNDEAAVAWVQELLTRHRVVSQVRKALAAKDDPDLPRIGAWLLATFGRPGAWPAATLREDLEAGIAGLQRVLDDDYGSDDINDVLRKEIDSLRRRLSELPG